MEIVSNGKKVEIKKVHSTPPGGLIGQVLIKASDEDYDVIWGDRDDIRNYHIYGVEWDGTATTKWTRTDDAALFTDPNPAVKNGTGSSPFDNLYPWKDMTIEERTGGTMVKEPKYWYKWTKTGKTMKLQIADAPVEGFHVDPVNMDRGDGLGELDFSYIGRYHCAKSTYKSETNKAQQVEVKMSDARTSIHKLGTNIWQIDFAQFWYIGMLYLVEFADWDGQATIGYGCSATGSKVNNGKTDDIQYHTGTTASNRTTYGFTQYRNIEGWWDNVQDWLDGCSNSTSGLYAILNPNYFADNTNRVLLGKPVDGNPSEFMIPDIEGLEWALFPIAKAGSDTTYVPDKWRYSSSLPQLSHGGNSTKTLGYGPFHIGYNSSYIISSDIGCRLQERPPKIE